MFIITIITIVLHDLHVLLEAVVVVAGHRAVLQVRDLAWKEAPPSAPTSLTYHEVCVYIYIYIYINNNVYIYIHLY